MELALWCHHVVASGKRSSGLGGDATSLWDSAALENLNIQRWAAQRPRKVCLGWSDELGMWEPKSHVPSELLELHTQHRCKEFPDVYIFSVDEILFVLFNIFSFQLFFWYYNCEPGLCLGNKVCLGKSKRYLNPLLLPSPTRLPEGQAHPYLGTFNLPQILIWGLSIHYGEKSNCILLSTVTQVQLWG